MSGRGKGGKGLGKGGVNKLRNMPTAVAVNDKEKANKQIVDFYK